jgi:hypothetical protein
MPKITKQFPAPSVDNPALLREFALKLAGTYRDMFPAQQGFAVELEDRSNPKASRLQIRILRGNFGGVQAYISSSRLVAQQISITVSKTSRMEHRLQTWFLRLAVILLLPFLLSGIFKIRPGHLLLISVPVFFLLAFLLQLVALSISGILGKLYPNFAPEVQSQIFNVVSDLPLPANLQRPQPSATVQPPPRPADAQALPKRTGPWPLS